MKSLLVGIFHLVGITFRGLNKEAEMRVIS